MRGEMGHSGGAQRAQGLKGSSGHSTHIPRAHRATSCSPDTTTSRGWGSAESTPHSRALTSPLHHCFGIKDIIHNTTKKHHRPTLPMPQKGPPI